LEVHSAVGRPWAQYLLGNCYEFGSQGLSRSFEQAAILYRQAAEQNYCQAMFSLGNLFRFGLGVNRCLAEASKWFALAAQCGDVTALYVLGILYFDQKRYDESFWQCQQAAIKGMVPAMRSTALLIEYRYAKAANTSTLQEAIYWYTLAAEHNDTQSQYRLFLCLSPSWRRRVPQEPLGFVDRPALVTSEDNSFVSTSPSSTSTTSTSTSVEVASPVAVFWLRQAILAYGCGPKAQDLRQFYLLDSAQIAATIHCAGCGRTATELISCLKCSMVAYCDEHCQSSHWTGLHKYECFTEKPQSLENQRDESLTFIETMKSKNDDILSSTEGRELFRHLYRIGCHEKYLLRIHSAQRYLCAAMVIGDSLLDTGADRSFTGSDLVTSLEIDLCADMDRNINWDLEGGSGTELKKNVSVCVCGSNLNINLIH
jgi:TPR repeat protein